MSTIVWHLPLICLWMLLLPLALREIVARRSLRQLLEVARHNLDATATRSALENHRAFVCDDQRHAQNPANTGFAFFYDCRAHELTIRGKVPPAQFWSLSLHDRYSRPIPEFLVDESVQTRHGEYEIRLSTQKKKSERNQLDVSSLPRGVAMLRISHLREPEELGLYLPKLSVAKTCADAGKGAPVP